MSHTDFASQLLVHRLHIDRLTLTLPSSMLNSPYQPLAKMLFGRITNKKYRTASFQDYLTIFILSIVYFSKHLKTSATRICTFAQSETTEEKLFGKAQFKRLHRLPPQSLDQLTLLFECNQVCLGQQLKIKACVRVPPSAVH